MTENNSKKSRGRPALVSEADFLTALRKSATPTDLINTFPSLQEMPFDEAKMYVAMRATTLRKKLGVAQVPQFRRGRRSGSTTTNNVMMMEPSSALSSPVMVADTVEENDNEPETASSFPVPRTRHILEE